MLKQHVRERCVRVEVHFYAYVTSAVCGVSCQLHALAVLSPGEESPGTHRIEGWIQGG
jgi:hypothetical protein